MKVLILGGFLGSGKTSLLVKLAKHVIGDDPNVQEAKVVILENEIGEVGVDDAILSSSGFEVENMFAGCICCSMAGQLVPTLEKLRKTYDPEVVIVEATGVACPKQIKDTIVGAGLKDDVRICTIVDAARWDRIKLALANLIESQLMDADTILVNKIDLVEPEKPDQVIEELKQINPDPKFFKVSAMENTDDSIWASVLGEDE
ncbi:MAG: CobW family GTP-binding protein [Coriobacteriales bacterium]|jgi:G3E family GTPase